MRVAIKEAYLVRDVYINATMRNRIQAEADRPLTWDTELGIVEYGTDRFPMSVIAKLVTMPQLVTPAVVELATDKLSKPVTKSKPKRSD